MQTETYIERLSRQIQEQEIARKEAETSLELVLRTCTDLKKLPALRVRLEAVNRMNRMLRCYRSAAKKIKKGILINDLHPHQAQALADAAELDGINLLDLLKSLMEQGQ